MIEACLALLVALCTCLAILRGTITSRARRSLEALDAASREDDPSPATPPLRSTRPWLLSALVAAFLGGIIAFTAGTRRPDLLIVAALTGTCVAYLIRSRRAEHRRRRSDDQYDFYLPLVMERVVMAVQAGLDIIPALERIYRIELDEKRDHDRIDPVSRLLYDAVELTERGMTLEEALKEVSHSHPSVSLRHAFMHLALAHRDGGELLVPLRELSDATQNYYQEMIEERIAKLPVKATLPLLCAFAGLIICFLTSPLVQVLMMTQQAIPKE
jgi:Flp pilus assembly protein TadB